MYVKEVKNITHNINACRMLEEKEYRRRHYMVTIPLHWCLCRKYRQERSTRSGTATRQRKWLRATKRRSCVILTSRLSLKPLNLTSSSLMKKQETTSSLMSLFLLTMISKSEKLTCSGNTLTSGVTRMWNIQVTVPATNSQLVSTTKHSLIWPK